MVGEPRVVEGGKSQENKKIAFCCSSFSIGEMGR